MQAEPFLDCSLFTLGSGVKSGRELGLLALRREERRTAEDSNVCHYI